MDKRMAIVGRRGTCYGRGRTPWRLPRDGGSHRRAGWTRGGGRLLLASLLVAGTAGAAQGREQLCDPQISDCRAPILTLIRNETRRIDVAFWFMTDSRYATEIIKRFEAGVDVRVLVDDRANRSHPRNALILDQLRSAGIPMRNKRAGGNLHWKMMLFDAQDVVQFSKANYSAPSFVPIQPNANWMDEAVYFTSNDRITNSCAGLAVGAMEMSGWHAPRLGRGAR